MSNFKNFAVWVLGALLLVALFNLFQSPSPQSGAGTEITFSRLLSDVDSGNAPWTRRPDGSRISLTGNSG